MDLLFAGQSGLGHEMGFVHLPYAFTNHNYKLEIINILAPWQLRVYTQKV